ncbi:hypothetical protein MMYC01_209878 [Madurella mycetomatis]|uniref:CCHC-type domain-containing protein n=1 Tax=Madurella mycetomatis TaxID=100816 RepID=A0A175VQT7_9PEZI|nr:hypothetical protein MMYC01_209878 [Madurella mycetomatis]
MTPTPAGLSAMAKQSTPKTMSSRLMTMKFMQRGAAAAAAAGASEASSPATPRSDDGSAKRQKTSHASSAADSPATPLYDQRAIQAALEEEEKKRQAAIEKRAAELGDSHWVLEGVSLPKSGTSPLLNVVQSQKKELRDSNDSDSGSSTGSEEVSGDERPPVQARDEPARGRRNAVGNSESGRTRSSASARRGEERKKAQQLASRRRKKDIKLNQLTSISSAGSQAFQRPSSALTCHGCGKPGHKVADCPGKKR